MNYYPSITCIKEDIRINKKNFKALYIIVFFRIANYFSQRRKFFLFYLFGLPIRIIYQLSTEWILNVEIPTSTKIGKGFCLHHGQGLVINRDTIIGDYVTLKHTTTIGCAVENNKCISSPIIGNNVVVHPHSLIIGGITIDDNVIIGAGSVVTKSIPKNAIVVGNPAKIIKYSKG